LLHLILASLIIIVLYTTVQRFGVAKIFFSKKWIRQGCIKLIKSDGEDIYNATKDLYFK